MHHGSRREGEEGHAVCQTPMDHCGHAPMVLEPTRHRHRPARPARKSGEAFLAQCRNQEHANTPPEPSPMLVVQGWQVPQANACACPAIICSALQRSEACHVSCARGRSAYCQCGSCHGIALSSPNYCGCRQRWIRGDAVVVVFVSSVLPEGRTAAARFFGQKPRAMLAALLASVALPPAPRSPPRRAVGESDGRRVACRGDRDQNPSGECPRNPGESKGVCDTASPEAHQPCRRTDG